jgi:DNA-directed RNA polymerase subunit RPC12/RpoP
MATTQVTGEERWELTDTDRGVGCTCPRCDGKLVVNMQKLTSLLRKQGLRGMICPYCERVSLLPRRLFRDRD